jgi:four helix bundle protein
MPGARRFEDLVCYQEARSLSLALDDWVMKARITSQIYIDQLQRAALSIQLNIAEGFNRYTHADFHRFLGMAKGSVGEVQALLQAAGDRRWIDAAIYADLRARTERLAKLLTRLMQYLRKNKRDR